MMLYLLKLLLSGVLLCSTYSSLIPFTESADIQTNKHAESKDFEFDFDSVFFDEEDDYLFMNEYLDTTAMDHISRAINPADIMVILESFGRTHYFARASFFTYQYSQQKKFA